MDFELYRKRVIEEESGRERIFVIAVLPSHRKGYISSVFDNLSYLSLGDKEVDSLDSLFDNGNFEYYLFENDSQRLALIDLMRFPSKNFVALRELGVKINNLVKMSKEGRGLQNDWRIKSKIISLLLKMEFIGKISVEKPNILHGELVRPLVLLEYGVSRYGFIPSNQSGFERNYQLYMHDLNFLTNMFKKNGCFERELEERDRPIVENVLDILSFNSGHPSKELTQNLMKMLRVEEN